MRTVHGGLRGERASVCCGACSAEFPAPFRPKGTAILPVLQRVVAGRVEPAGHAPVALSARLR